MTKYLVDFARLLPGDILLTSATSVPSKAIRLATASNYSHAAIWVGGTFIEAILDGVFSASPQRLLFDDRKEAAIYRRRVPLTKDQVDLVCRYARSQTGTLYAFSELSLLSLGRYKKLGIPATKRQFCSRLVAKAYEYAECDLSKWVNADFCTPRMISLSKTLHLVPDMVREALPEELEFAASPDPIKMNQDQLFKWLGGVRRLAKSDSILNDNFDIQSENDACDFLCSHKELDEEATVMLRASGYLTFYNHDTTVDRVKYRYHDALMVRELSMIHNREEMLHRELDKEPELFKRFGENMGNNADRYLTTEMEFFREMLTLYKNLLTGVYVRLKVLVTGFNYIGDRNTAASVSRLAAIVATTIHRGTEALASNAGTEG